MDDGDLVFWEKGVAGGVFSIVVLKDAPFLYGLGG